VADPYQAMVVRRHDDGSLEIVTEGTEMQLVSRELLRKMVASLNQSSKELERLRAAGDEVVAAVAAVSCGGPPKDMHRLERAYSYWQEARRG